MIGQTSKFNLDLHGMDYNQSLYIIQQCLINTIILLRYLCRAVLVPFTHKPPKVSPDVLDKVLEDARAAFPELLRVGKYLEDMESNAFKVNMSCMHVQTS